MRFASNPTPFSPSLLEAALRQVGKILSSSRRHLSPIRAIVGAVCGSLAPLRGIRVSFSVSNMYGVTVYNGDKGSKGRDRYGLCKNIYGFDLRAFQNRLAAYETKRRSLKEIEFYESSGVQIKYEKKMIKQE
ncbi:hypothetical protein ABEB36_003323 [Hypothenemus hampei]|uniref:Uncharacterized protein n=1 Tax=Hypothenemus hampei TaxID=57062 RepID=A0ABD1F8S8_HYPHA